ncbi:MAG: flagellar hook-basal body complex protein FliE [Nitrospinae bacterium]|nr:flagellar hook-basal body complex protein FliE [Nitrospinota bacterium]
MADMKIHSDFKPLASALNLPKVTVEPSKGFGEVLKETMNEVNKLQLDADKSVEDLATGKNKNIHETMISISKADLAFRMTMQVRNKVMDAYQEVMRMSV